jgi:hypothetical protein
MDSDLSSTVEQANQESFERICAAQPFLVDVVELREFGATPHDRFLTHSGPPITWDRMSGAQKGAIVAAARFEGWASDPDEVDKLLAHDAIGLIPNHHLNGVGPMAGVFSPSMKVFVVQDRTSGKRAYSGIEFDALYGAYDDEAIEELRLWHGVLYPAIGRAVREAGGLALKPLMAKALTMGDELHSRQTASSALLATTLIPWVLRTSRGDDLSRTVDVLAGAELTFLPLSMAACKVSLLAADGVSRSTVVTTMARNGTDFGIRVSGLGDTWFTAPAPVVETTFFQGFGPADAGLDIGDSAITETGGLGACALAGAPAISELVGGKVADLRAISLRMRDITVGLNPSYAIAALDGAGTATGIDVRKVVQSSVAPTIDTATAHREPGHRIIGAGISHAPLVCFTQALDAWFDTYLDAGDDPARKGESRA